MKIIAVVTGYLNDEDIFTTKLTSVFHSYQTRPHCRAKSLTVVVNGM